MWKLLLLVCFTVNVLVYSHPLDEPAFEGHIFGGNNTDITKVPHQVALLVEDSFECGGFIVSPIHIVTAGHCIARVKDLTLSIRAGSSSNRNGGVVVNVKKVYMHHKYDDIFIDYDVAVMELETPLKLNNKTMKAIKLATKEPSAGSVVLTSGWGFINEDLADPKTLQSVSFPVYDRTKCAAAYEEQDFTITPRMICGGSGGKNAYCGDDGGAVVYKGEAVGIASFIVGVSSIHLPGVHTNIADPEILKFIKDVTKL